MPGGLAILIVDDDDLHRWTWKKILENRYGDRVRVAAFAASGDALAHLEGRNSLVLLDWHMPDLDVKTFLDEAARRGVGPELVVLFSGSDRSLLEETFGKSGCLALVEKGREDEEQALLRLLDDRIYGRFVEPIK